MMTWMTKITTMIKIIILITITTTPTVMSAATTITAANLCHFHLFPLVGDATLLPLHNRLHHDVRCEV